MCAEEGGEGSSLRWRGTLDNERSMWVGNGRRGGRMKDPKRPNSFSSLQGSPVGLSAERVTWAGTVQRRQIRGLSVDQYNRAPGEVNQSGSTRKTMFAFRTVRCGSAEIGEFTGQEPFVQARFVLVRPLQKVHRFRR